MRNNIKTLVLSIALSIYSITTFAANSSGNEDFMTMADPAGPGSDPGVTPISDYIIPMLVLGIALSFYLLKKRKTA
jgi:hypothetical protein